MLWTFRRQGGGVPAGVVAPEGATHFRFWIGINGDRDAIEFTDNPAAHPQEPVACPPIHGGAGRWRLIE
jgi:hypothetical protein